MVKNKEIDEIYICKNSISIISKVLIRFIDGSYDYFKLPSFYSELTFKNKMKELKKLIKELEFYLKQFQKQKDLAEDCFDHEKLMICKEESWLATYMDMMIRAIDQENNKKNRELFDSESDKLMAGISLSLWATFFIMAQMPIVTFLTTIGSEMLFVQATRDNKNRGKVKSEKYLTKKLKLYFSYFMLSFNIGFNFVDIDYNKETSKFDITFDKPEFLKDESDKLSYLMEGVRLNTNLSEEASAVILSLEEFMLENPYFDYEEAYDNLTPLEVEYSTQSRGNVAGAYYEELDLIRIYNSDEISKEEKETFMQHESIHCVGSLDNIALNEGMTSLIQAEYFNDGVISDAYYDHVWLTRIFCELITPEKMLEAYSKKDISIIKKEMLKINSNEEDYEKLFLAMQIFGFKFQENDGEIISSLNYRYILSEDLTLSEIFDSLLEPYYLNYEKVSEETKKQIDDYISYIGYYHNPIDNKLYFNKENTLEKSYVKKID